MAREPVGRELRAEHPRRLDSNGQTGARCAIAEIPTRQVILRGSAPQGVTIRGPAKLFREDVRPVLMFKPGTQQEIPPVPGCRLQGLLKVITLSVEEDDRAKESCVPFDHSVSTLNLSCTEGGCVDGRDHLGDSGSLALVELVLKHRREPLRQDHPCTPTSLGQGRSIGLRTDPPPLENVHPTFTAAGARGRTHPRRVRGQVFNARSVNRSPQPTSPASTFASLLRKAVGPHIA